MNQTLEPTDTIRQSSLKKVLLKHKNVKAKRDKSRIKKQKKHSSHIQQIIEFDDKTMATPQTIPTPKPGPQMIQYGGMSIENSGNLTPLIKP